MSIETSEKHFRQGLKIRESVLGLQDGVVSTLGIVLGVSFSIGEPRIVLIAGLAAVFAEGISMFFSQYAASRSLKKFVQQEIQIEKQEIYTIPEQERWEIYESYKKKGFKGQQLEDIVETITKNRKVWLETMKNEELRWLPLNESTPVKDAVIVGIASVFGGLFPVWPFAFLGLSMAIPFAILSAAILLFSVGVIQTKITGGHWLRNGTELLAVGAIAAIAGYLIGTLLQGLTV